MSLVEHELLTLPEHLISPLIFSFSGVHVAHSLIFCVLFCWSMFVLLSLLFWSLYCLSFYFGHCIVCPFILVTVLSVLLFWSLYCLSFYFGHCIACPFILVTVLPVLLFWSLYCLSFFDLRLLITPAFGILKLFWNKCKIASSLNTDKYTYFIYRCIIFFCF
jgi:hypothetical protein